MPGIVEHELSFEHKATNTFDTFITNRNLRKITKKLYEDGHHARAVEEAYKHLDNIVRKFSGINETGAKLMQSAFSPNNPHIKLNAGNSSSEMDEQKGFLQIFSGCMTGIRNPRAHECEWEDSEIHALQLLIWANYLVDRVENARICPRKLMVYDPKTIE